MVASAFQMVSITLSVTIRETIDAVPYTVMLVYNDIPGLLHKNKSPVKTPRQILYANLYRSL